VGPDKSYAALDDTGTRTLTRVRVHVGVRQHPGGAKLQSSPKSIPRTFTPRQQIEIYDAASGNSLSLLYSSGTDLQRVRGAGTTLENFGTKLNARPRPLHAFRHNVPDLQVHGKRRSTRVRNAGSLCES